MKTFLKIAAGLVAFVVVLVGLIMFFTSGSRDIAKQFVILNSTGSHAEARALMHPGLQDKISTERMAEMFDGVQAYEKVSFGSVSTGSGKPTVLEGTATTASGCMSTLKFEMLNEQIISFDVTPLCR